MHKNRFVFSLGRPPRCAGLLFAPFAVAEAVVAHFFSVWQIPNPVHRDCPCLYLTGWPFLMWIFSVEEVAAVALSSFDLLLHHLLVASATFSLVVAEVGSS
jgi:hypothetical protein